MAELNMATPPLLSTWDEDPPVTHSGTLAGISASVAGIQDSEQHAGRTARLIAWVTALLATLLVLTLLPMPAFAQDDPSGAYESGVPIEVPAFHGLEPDLGLTYNSNSGNGPLGVGWDISALSEIARAAPGKGTPRYDDNDIFLLDGMELIPCEQDMQSPSCDYSIDDPGYKAYTTKQEGFQRIAFQPTRDGGRWHVWEKNGTQMTYWPGVFANRGTFEWELTRVEDTLGNEVTYSYRSFPGGSSDTWGERYVDSVTYNGAEIDFYWEERPDKISYTNGSGLVSMRHRLKTVDVLVGGERARAYALSYEQRDSSTSRSMLKEVQQYGRDATLDASGTITGGTALPPITLHPVEGGAAGEWEHAAAAETRWGPQGMAPTTPMFREGAIPLSSLSLGETIWVQEHLHGDVDGDGRDDAVRVSLHEGEHNGEEGRWLRISTTIAGPGEDHSITKILPWYNYPYCKGSKWADLAWGFIDECPEVSPMYGITRLLVTDVDGDSRDDVVFLINYDQPRQEGKDDMFMHLHVAFSEGGGDFAYGPRVEGPSNPYVPQFTDWEDHLIEGAHARCQSADANGDGKSDIMCKYFTNDHQGRLGTALSRGNGRFDVHSTTAPGRGITVGDTNGDGLDDAMFLSNSDLVTAKSSGTGDYEFMRQEINWSGVRGLNPNAPDLNGDGKADIVFPWTDDKLRTALTQPGSPHFEFHETPLPHPLNACYTYDTADWVNPADAADGVNHADAVNQCPASPITFGDVDGDGKDDMLIETVGRRHGPQFLDPRTCAGVAYEYEHPVLTRVTSNGDGTFRWPKVWGNCDDPAVEELNLKAWAFEQDPRIHTPRYLMGSSRAADTNGDGKADFLSTYYTREDPDEEDLTHRLVSDTVSPHSGRETSHWLPADLNGDGRQDYVYPYQRRNYVDHPEADPPVITVPGGGTQAQRFYTLIAREDGGYDHKVSEEEYTGAYRGVTGNWKVADANGDGTSDLVYVRKEKDSLWVDTFLYRGNGQWDTVSKQVGVANPRDSVLLWKAMDVDGDGKGDLVNVTSSNAELAGPCQPIQGRLDRIRDEVSRLSDELHAAAGNHELIVELGDQIAALNGKYSEELANLDDCKKEFGTPPFLVVQTILSRLDAQGEGSWEFQPRSWSGAQLGGDVANFRPADVNGDGRMDLLHVYHPHNKTFEEPTLWAYTLSYTGAGEWDRHLFQWTPGTDNWGDYTAADVLNWRVADVNADGSTDLIHPTPTEGGLRLHALVSGGSGDVWVRRWQDVDLGSHAGVDGWSDTTSWKVADVNADGRADLVHPYDSNDELEALLSQLRELLAKLRTANPIEWFELTKQIRELNTKIDAARARGPSVRVDTVVSVGDASWEAKPQQAEPLPGNVDPNHTRWDIGDANGDGTDDLFRVDSASQEGGGARVSTLLSTAPLDLTAEESNGMGATTEISYSPSSAHPVRNPSEDCHLPVGVTRQSVSSITTRDGRANADTTTYSYGCARWSYDERIFLGWEDVTATREAAPNRPQSVSREHFGATDECGARLVESVLEDDQGRPLTRSETDFGQLDTALPYLCLPESQSEKTFDQQTGAFTTNLTQFERDKFGNVTEVREYGNPKLADGDRTTVTEFAASTDPYVVGLPRRERILEGIGEQGEVKSDTIFCYDYDAECQTPPSKGLLTKTKEWNNKESRYHETSFEFDEFGNQTKVTDANRHAATTAYDQTYHIFPEKICNALDQCTEQKFDPVIGQVKQSTDPNGNTTYFDFDELARPKGTRFPNGGEVQLSYPGLGDPQNQRVRQVSKDGTDDGLWTESYFDGLGRTYRTLKEGDHELKQLDQSGSMRQDIFTQDTIYTDTSSKPYQQSHWYAQDFQGQREQPVYYETFHYDAADRPVEQTHPDASSLEWAYGVEDERSYTASFDELDYQKRHPKRLYSDAFGRTVLVREVNAGENYDTTYDYDVLDNPIMVTDDQQNVTTVVYDSLGRKLSIDDPDTGHSTYSYDNVGNMLSQTDAKQQTTRFTYDEIDRMEIKTLPDGKKTTWNYDEPEGHGESVGMLTSVSDPTGASCEGGRSEGYVYDNMGQVVSETKCVLGKSFSTGYSYDELDRQASITYPDGEKVTNTYDSAGRLKSVQGYVEGVRYDAAGNVISTALANGTRESFAHDPEREWLTKASVSGGAGALYQADYTHAVNGLVTSTSSTTNKMNLQFTYDDLNRLTGVSGDTKQSFAYDSIGNMTSNSKLGAYTYSASQPHAVVQAGTQHYAYDANGNTTLRNGKQMVWNPENQPEWIEGQLNTWTHSLYDSTGQRVFEAVSNKSPSAKSPPAAPAPAGAAPSPQQPGGGTQPAASGQPTLPGDPAGGAQEATTPVAPNANGAPSTTANPDPVAPQGQSTVPIGGAGQAATSTGQAVGGVGASPLQSGGQVAQGVAQPSGKVLQGTTGQAAQQSGAPAAQQPSQGAAQMAPRAGQATQGVGAASGQATAGVSSTTAQATRQAGQVGQGAQGATAQVVPNANGTPPGTAAKPIPGAGGGGVIAGNGPKSTYYFGPLLEYSLSEGLTKYYYAGSRLIARNNRLGKQFYHQDHLGSTRLMTDQNGRVVQRYDYAPFGELMSQTNPTSGQLSNDIQFGGNRQDEESGLTYMGARYYDPKLGRFTSADTIVPDPTNPQALNRYSYVYNNPLSYTDPSGHYPEGTTDTYVQPGSVSWIDDAGYHMEFFDGGQSTNYAPLISAAAQGARGALRSTFRPVDIEGTPLKGPFNLWSGATKDGLPGQAAAEAAPGYTIAKTNHGTLADAYETDKAPFGETWPPASKAAAIDAALSETPVASYGLDTHPSPATTIQSTIEIPTVAKYATVPAGLMAISGAANIYSAAQSDNTAIQVIGVGGGTAEVVGALTYGSGAASANAPMMALGSNFARYGGAAGGIVSAYNLYGDVERGDWASGVGNFAGTLTSGLTFVGASSGAAVTGSFAAGYAVGTVANHWVGPWIDSYAPGSGAAGEWYYKNVDPYFRW